MPAKLASVRAMTRLLAAFLALIASIAQAQTPFPPSEPPSPHGPYAGGLLGRSEAKSGCVGILSGGNRDCDAKDFAYGVFAGAQFHRYFGAEIGYINFGKVKANSTGPTSAASENVAADAWDIALLGILPISDIFSSGRGLSAFVRGGAYRATLSTSVRGVEDSTNGGYTYGAGLQFDITPKIGLRALFERYKRVGRDPYLNNNYDVLGVSAFYRFQ